MKKRKRFFVVAAMIIGSQLCAQQDKTAVEDSTGVILDEVLLTASKFPRKQTETGKVTTVIGREMIERNTGRTVMDILNQQAGLAVIGSQNILGSNQELYLRGSGKTLVLLDGVPAYDASSVIAAFDLNNIPLENIERIEILKGGQSTLYGSDAIAGVINIITKKSGAKKWGGLANLSGGSFDTYRSTLGVNGNSSALRYNLQYSHTSSKGFSAAFDSSGREQFDKDGYRHNVISGQIGTTIKNSLRLRVNGQAGHYRTDLDAAGFTDDDDFAADVYNYQAGLHADQRAGKGSVFFNLNYNATERKYLNDSADVSGFSKYEAQQYRGYSWFAELFSNQPITEQLEILAGVDYRQQSTDQHYFSLSSFGPYETHIGKDSVKNKMYSAFASVLLKNISGFHLETGARLNRHSLYGNNATYTFNPSYNLLDRWKFFVNISSAFKAPSLYQLFGPGVANAGLEAEKSVTWEGGSQWQDEVVNLRAVYFFRSIRNGIDYNLESFTYFNNNKQQDRGLELEAGFKKGRVNIQANYTYVTGEVTTWKFEYDPNSFSYVIKGDTTFNNLFRRPKHALNLFAGFSVTKKLELNSSLRIAGKRYEGQFQASPVPLDSYYTWDLFAQYSFNKHIRIFGDFRNITDQQFFDVRGFNSRRFNFMTGVSLTL